MGSQRVGHDWATFAFTLNIPRFLQWPAVNLFDFSTFSFSFMSALVTKARLCVLSHSVTSDSLDRSLPGSSVLGLSQARILEQVASSFSRGSSWPQGSNPYLLCFQHCRQILYLLSHQRSPVLGYFASNIPWTPLCGGECHGLHRCTFSCCSRVMETDTCSWVS